VRVALTWSAPNTLRMERLTGPGLTDPGLSGHLDGVPGTAQRRGVGQVQVADLIDGHAVEDRRRGDVDPLGDLGVLVAEQLHAQEPAGGAVAGDAQGDPVAARIVGLVSTVCNLAREELGGKAAVHWSVPDPVPAGDAASFDTAVTDLSDRVGRLAPRLAAPR